MRDMGCWEFLAIVCPLLAPWSLVRRLCDPQSKRGILLLHRWPEGVLLVANPGDHLIQMPGVTTTRATTAPFLGLHLDTCEAPLPHGFLAPNTPCSAIRSSTGLTLSEKRKDRQTA